MPDDELILVRTEPGQHAVFDDVLLGERAMRLLRLVNGYTRLGELIARLDASHDWHAAACDLLDKGLVIEQREVTPQLSTTAVGDLVEEP